MAVPITCVWPQWAVSSHHCVQACEKSSSLSDAGEPMTSCVGLAWSFGGVLLEPKPGSWRKWEETWKGWARAAVSLVLTCTRQVGGPCLPLDRSVSEWGNLRWDYMDPQCIKPWRCSDGHFPIMGMCCPSSEGIQVVSNGAHAQSSLTTPSK